MAVAHDAVTESHTGTTASQSEASFTWEHDPVGTPRGVLVFTFCIGSSTELATSVTYEGASLTAVTGGSAVDTAGEPGRCTAWFLGSSVPTADTATVVVNRTNNASVLYAICVTVTAGGDTDYADVQLVEGDGTLGELNVDDGSPGSDSVRYAAAYFGGVDPAPPGANSTALISIDPGARVAGAVMETTAGQGDRPVGFASGSDDRAAVYLAILQVGGAPVELASTPAGVATVTGNLTRVLQAQSTVAGVATVTAALTVTGGTIELASAPAGVATVTASLHQTHNAASSITGEATVTAALDNIAGGGFDWTKVMVAPTGSSGLDSGSHTSVDEIAPWSDADVASETVASLATEVAIFSGFDLSQAGGEVKGFHIWSRMAASNAAGFLQTITLKQDTTTLWTSDPFTVDNTSLLTYIIPVPNSAFVGSDIDNLSLEFSNDNQLAGSNTLSWSWLRISKSPFTALEEASLPSTLVGQDYVVYRARDLVTLGGTDGEGLFMLADASGNGRHSVLRVGSVTLKTDSPVGFLTSSSRFVGALGYDTTADAAIRWSNDNIFHASVYPTSITTDHVIFSNSEATDFIGHNGVADKNLMGIEAASAWVLMSGDGTGPAHLSGGTPVEDVAQRVTEWIQNAGGNEHLWEEDDATPVVDGDSGDNPFGFWSLFNRESDNRPWVGRIMEVWYVEGTGITEADIDAARSEWVNGYVEMDATVAGVATVTGDLESLALLQSAPAGVATVTGDLTRVLQAQATVTGIATVSGILNQVHNAAGSINGVATVTAALTQTQNLVGSTAGVATVTADLDTVLELHARTVFSVDFPEASTPTPSIFSTAATSHAVAMPATVPAGSLLVVGFVQVSSSVATPDGWTHHSTTVHFSGPTLNVFSKRALGTEGGTTVDFVTAVTRRAVAHTYLIEDCATIEVADDDITGTSVNPNPGTLTASWGSAANLWMVMAGHGSGPLVSSYPANYINGTDDNSTGTQSTAIDSAIRLLESDTEDPGTYTLDSSAQWAVETIAVSPVLVSAQGVATVTATLTAGAAGTTNELAGQSDGIATVTASLQTLAEASGTVAGVGTVTGALSQIQNLSGASDGSSTVTGDLEAEAPLASAVAGVATVTGSLTQIQNLTATTTGAATVGGSADVLALASGASTGQATVVAALHQIQNLSGTINGVGTVVAAVAPEFITANSDGIATVSGNLTQINNLSGSVAGAGAVSGEGDLIYQLNSTVAGQATVTASLSLTQSVAATIAGIASVSGDLEQVHQLGSTVNGAATVTAALTSIGLFAGAANGVGSVNGALLQIQHLSGTIVGVGAVTASLSNIPLVTRGTVTIGDAIANSVTASDVRVQSVGTTDALLASVSSGDD